jgi:hypothetical protein
LAARLTVAVAVAALVLALWWALTPWGTPGHWPNRGCITNTDGFNPHAIKGLPICQP